MIKCDLSKEYKVGLPQYSTNNFTILDWILKRSTQQMQEKHLTKSQYPRFNS